MKIKYSIDDIKTIRHPKNPLTAFLIYDPASIWPTWFLSNFTRITPNQISVTVLLIGFFAVWCFFQAATPYLILGALLLLLTAILDYTDGKIARLKNQKSALGMFLDGPIDIPYLSILALTYGQARITNQIDFLLFGGILILLWVIIRLFGYKREEIEGSYGEKNQELIVKANRYIFLGKIKKIKDYFESKGLIPIFTATESAFLVLIIGPIFGIIKECLVLSLILSVPMLILYFTVNVIHFSKFKRT